MKNEYDALNRATVRPEEYAPVPLGEAQQAAQFRRLLAAASAQADGGAAAGTPRRRALKWKVSLTYWAACGMIRRKASFP